jgi:hypothetical protein
LQASLLTQTKETDDDDQSKLHAQLPPKHPVVVVASSWPGDDDDPTDRRFAARLLFDHPHSYREWNIVGQYEVPGFFYLESRFRLNPGEQPAIYTVFELCLHERQFERVQV